MILVTVGVSNLPFDRLVGAVGELAAGDETVVAQCGAARVRPRGAVCFDYLPFVELAEWVSKARLVVCHAGIGSVAMCLSRGLRPIVVPRRKQLGECVDQHQVTFAQRLGDLGLATVVEDVSYLAEAVRSAPGRQPPTGLSRELADELIAYIEWHAAPDGRPRQGARGSREFGRLRVRLRVRRRDGPTPGARDARADVLDDVGENDVQVE